MWLGLSIHEIFSLRSQAAKLLCELPQPFTTSEARSRLGTSRRVVLPLLEHLDRARLTRRLADNRRQTL